ncbi:unnamed protein product [Arabis nemorensis]|uniref:Uncharacterized protein n=1 Tax=Arabis nemorensis TaxID=586526 RepID=A0A565BK91_9BRAS|nr:unnamed protein product [Arabis nemorensis]
MLSNLITEPTIIGAQSVLEEIFTEEQMVTVYRVHLERLYSNPIQYPQQLPRQNFPAANPEIIVLDVDDDSNTGPAQNNIHASGLPPNVSDHQGPTNEEVDGIRLTQEHHDFGDVGINLLDDYMQTNENHNYAGVDDAMLYWEGLMAEAAIAEENRAVPEMVMEEAMPQTIVPPPVMVSNPVLRLALEPTDEFSSTDSSSETYLTA